jgi:ribosomal protein S20
VNIRNIPSKGILHLQRGTRKRSALASALT